MTALAQTAGVHRAERAYAVACVVLAVLLGSQALLHRWGSDVWHHGAVVRTVAHDPLDPSHPVLPGDAPHPFFVPSSLLAGTIAAATDAGPFDALVVIALVNLGLLLAGVWFFVTALCPRSPWVPLVVLGFMLFLWGPRPWGYSGFLHMNQIGQSLPFPSAFGFGTALLALAALVRWIETSRPARLVASLVLAALAVLSHPVAAMLLCTVTGAVLLRHVEKASAWIGAIGMGLASLAAALAWPYYPFFGLIDVSAAFDASNRVLYEGTLLRTLPLLPGFAVAAGRLRRDRRDPLAVAILGLAAIYVAGFALERWSLGRVMSPLAFLLQVALADWVVAHRGTLAEVLTAPGRRKAVARTAALGLAALAAWNMAPGLVRTLPPALLPDRLAQDPRLAPVDHRHGFLGDWIEYGDVVLARPKTGWGVPVYGGKILAPALPQGFVDTSAMAADVETFFAPGTARALRREIAERYDARWILVDTVEPEAGGILSELGTMGEPVAADAGLHLHSLRRERP